MGLVKATAVVVVGVGLLAVGYRLGKIGSGIGDDQPIVVTGGSFFIDTNKGHGFSNNNGTLAHVDTNSRTLKSVDLYSVGDTEDSVAFANGAISIQIGYCAAASSCPAGTADDIVTFQTNPARRNLQIATNPSQIFGWAQNYSMEWERTPRPGYLMKWVAINGTPASGSLPPTRLCPADGTCRIWLHYGS
jgi:hypothetical protein